jgi:Fe-S oxidoreductase
LKNEYPAFGGNFEVIHHTQLLEELLQAGRITPQPGTSAEEITFHDPCYLGRQNGVFEAPREAVRRSGANLREMPRSRARSFCCGAGGSQMWKEEEKGVERVNAARVREAMATGADTLAVGCPFCMVMLTDAARDAGDRIRVRDVVEILADRLPPPPSEADPEKDALS